MDGGSGGAANRAGSGWVRELASSHQDLAAQRAEAEAILDAVRRGDRLIRELDALDDAKGPEL
jgi:hypothetical protein